MNRLLPSALALGILCTFAQQGTAATARYLNTELKALLDQVASALEKDVALAGTTVSLGRISSRTCPDSNYAPEMRRIVESQLKGKLVPLGSRIITIDYNLVPSDQERAEGTIDSDRMQVLLIRVIIEDRNLKELFNKSVEVNDSADIARVLGLNVAPPANGSQRERNTAIRQAYYLNLNKPAEAVRPTFQVKAATQIGIPGDSRFFVEILVKDRPDGPTAAIRPVANARGNAFVDLKHGQFYELVIHNRDVHDCVARIRIDGQDALNRFNRDGKQWVGLLVQKGKSGLLRGWMHTIAPRPVEKDNVFAFAVREYAHGSADPIKATGEVGVITVQFAVAWKEGEARPVGREIGRVTDKGPGLDQKFTVEKRHVGQFNETISIRYSPTAQ